MGIPSNMLSLLVISQVILELKKIQRDFLLRGALNNKSGESVHNLNDQELRPRY